MIETVTTGRAKRSTAGNRMRELLEKAHQENEDDALFAEEADDGEFEAPQDVRDVYLDEFADTDDELEDEDAEERELRRAERQDGKGKAKVGFNPPVVKAVRMGSAATPLPSADQLALLDPAIDVSKMAPSTLILEIRKQRREAKRLQRSENRRSNLRASTLKTEEDLIEKEKQEKIALASSRKGRKAQHETGEVRGARPMTQDELIAAALEEEERNKEALVDWLRREEERRELRRVGRKRVRGPRWTWISRTVGGRLVEVVGEEGCAASATTETPALAQKSTNTGETTAAAVPADSSSDPSKQPHQQQTPVSSGDSNNASAIENGAEAASAQEGAARTERGLAETAVGGESVNNGDGGKISANVESGNESGTKEAAGAESAATTATTTTTLLPDTSTSSPTAAGSAAKEEGASASTPATDAKPTTASGDALQAKAADPPVVTTDEHSKEKTPTAGDDTTTEPTAPATASTEPATPAAATERKTGSAEPTAAALTTTTADPTATSDPNAPPPEDAPTGPYMRNYLILSQVPGGLPAELRLILGDHVDWSSVTVIPARNRPINRKPPLDPLSGTAARYRHPGTMLPYSCVESYGAIEGVLRGQYAWSEAGWWAGGEADMAAEGVEEVKGWKEACARGWLGGEPVPVEEEEGEKEEPEKEKEGEAGDGVGHEQPDVPMEEGVEAQEEEPVVMEPPTKSGGRKRKAPAAPRSKAAKPVTKRRR